MFLLVIAAFAAFAAAIICLWYIFVLRHQRSLKLPYPPGPPPVFFWGNALSLPDIRKGYHLDLKLLEWSKEYGTVFTIYLPIVGPMIVCADPDWVAQVAIRQNYPKSFTYQVFTPVFGEKSILMLHGQEWMDKRRAFNPGFSPFFLKDMVSTMAIKLERLVIKLDQDANNGVATHMLRRTQTFTSDVIMQVALGEDWGDSDTYPQRLWLTELMELSTNYGNDPLVRFFGVRTWRRIQTLERRLDQEFERILEKRLASLATSQTKKSTKEKKKNILSIAMDQLQGTDGSSLTKDDKTSILHQLKTCYVAGHDTTATLISWALWLLSQHEDVLKKLRDELKQHGIWDSQQGHPTYDQLQKCTLLEAILKESLRLYPPAASARYTSDTSQTFRNYTLGGAVLYLNAYVMHRHPSNWKNPDAFDPERFLTTPPEEVATKWIPFLRGSRDCLGKYFATLEAKLAVSRLVLRYEMECVDPDEEICYKVTAVPRNGAQVKLSLRKKE